MIIRKTEATDLMTISKIYAYAREQMKASGNPNQWKDNRPPLDSILNDVMAGNAYVIVHEDEIVGAFSWIIGDDPTYQVIEDGAWLDDAPYGVIHKVASAGKVKGIMDVILDFCLAQMSNIRIDTHEDNKIMRHMLEKRGFKRCGIIYVDDGTPRIAYQLIK